MGRVVLLVITIATAIAVTVWLTRDGAVDPVVAAPVTAERGVDEASAAFSADPLPAADAAPQLERAAVHAPTGVAAGSPSFELRDLRGSEMDDLFKRYAPPVEQTVPRAPGDK